MRCLILVVKLCGAILFLGVSAACSIKPGGALDIARHLLGYTPPPEPTSIGEELALEFERCNKIDPERNCAQIAFDMVRNVKGLEPRRIPEGIVIILEGDGGHGDLEQETQLKAEQIDRELDKNKEKPAPQKKQENLHPAP